MTDVNFFELKGQTITAIRIDESEHKVFIQTTEHKYQLRHYQDCCESVHIERIVGKPENILSKTIVLAEEDSTNDNPEWAKDRNDFDFSHTWSLYRIIVEGGELLDIWWLGESNGYYSETVSFERIDE
jgi:hypothetical protein